MLAVLCLCVVLLDVSSTFPKSNSHNFMWIYGKSVEKERHTEKFIHHVSYSGPLRDCASRMSLHMMFIFESI